MNGGPEEDEVVSAGPEGGAFVYWEGSLHLSVEPARTVTILLLPLKSYSWVTGSQPRFLPLLHPPITSRLSRMFSTEFKDWPCFLWPRVRDAGFPSP